MTWVISDTAARRRLDEYLAEVDRILARAETEAAELRADLAAHVADSMASMSAGTDAERLDAALARLGRPSEYLHPLLADEMIERGTRSYSPITIARGLGHAVLAGSQRTAIGLAFGFGYLLLAIFASAAVLKPLWGDHVGLFRHPDGTISAGIVANASGARELLGWWSIPIALALTSALYVVLTIGLRAVRKR